MKLITLIAATTSAVKVQQDMPDYIGSMPDSDRWFNMPAPLYIPDLQNTEEIGSLYIELVDQ